MAKRGKRRRWSADEKRMICAQTRFAGVSVSQVARRYNVNANQVFNWLKDPRFAGSDTVDDAACFLPVEIARHVEHEAERPVGDEGKIEVTLAGGHRLSISGPYDPEALVRLLRCLSG
ncbi:MAG: transposase [Alphaproteobacteria bacterium]|nr:transposase [Alphaproteobacteria bacterium]NKB55109.1 transposase [Alphaproteobacteria bacterium]NKB55296.1 transposase [Alphaproteobacteria bacterium]NKB55334.1 transposase [Alphaproteobacteria bacterium]NKB55504.1 transposase [Alphaproteobacteria bacterium]